ALKTDTAITAGEARGPQIVHEQAGAVPVAVKNQLKGIVSGLPARSRAPVVTVAVYVVPAVSGAVGVSVDVGASPPATTDAATSVPDPSRSWNVLVLIDEKLIISLKVAVTTVVSGTPVAPDAGVTDCTVGGV